MRIRACRGAAALTVCLAAVLALCSSVLPASAQMAIDTWGRSSMAGPTTGFGASNLGWFFQVSETVTVDALGLWDEGSDGVSAHQVALWNAETLALLAATTVSNSSTQVDSELSFGNWLFESISGVDLHPGVWYAVSAQYAADNTDLVRIFGGLTVAPFIAISSEDGAPMVSSAGVSSADLACPTTSLGPKYGAYGPNFHVAETADVPEPGSLALLGGLGVAALISVRRLKRRAK